MNKNIAVYLKFAKAIAPKIFEDATPKIHLRILDFVLGDGRFKACAVFRGAGKSTLLNKILILCRVFFEHEPFVIIVSSDGAKAESFLRDIKEMVLSAESKGFAIRKGKIWGADRVQIITKNENGDELSSFIVAMGAGQDPRGYTHDYQRPTLIIADDVESKLGQYAIMNERNRRKLREWFFADLIPALHPSRGKIVLIGTILHEDSLLNNIITAKEKGEWQTLLIPIMDGENSAWKSRFPMNEIERIKNTLKAQGLENEFYQEYMCHAIAPEKQLFRREYLRFFEGLMYDERAITFSTYDAKKSVDIKINPAKYIKAGAELIALRDCAVYTTMDLASYNGHDRTAIVTFAVDKKNRIFVLDCVLGHWTPFEKAVKAHEVYLKFSPQRFGMEKAGAQNDMFYTIAELCAKTGVNIPIEPLTHHSRSKNVRIANLHPYFVSGRVWLNRYASGMDEMIAELLSFDPDVESKYDDAIDALAYLQEYVVNRWFDEDDENEPVYVERQSWF